MDATIAILLGGLDLMQWIERVLWVSLRTGGLLMLSPFLGTQAVPKRVRLILALTLSLAFAPLIPAPALSAAMDAATFLAVARELAIGAALGFMLRIAVEATAMAGELVAQGMGLSFAQMIDPMRGTQSGVMTQWFMIIAGLLFFALDTHIALLRVLVESFQTLPPAATPQSMSTLLDTVPAFSGIIFATGVSLALPAIIAMLALNIAFGVMSRTAPSLNPIAIGLPAALLAGLVLLIGLVPFLLEPVRALFESALLTASQMVH